MKCCCYYEENDAFIKRRFIYTRERHVIVVTHRGKIDLLLSQGPPGAFKFPFYGFVRQDKLSLENFPTAFVLNDNGNCSLSSPLLYGYCKSHFELKYIYIVHL